MVSKMKKPVPPVGCKSGVTRPEDGRICSVAENSKMSRMPDQKTGIDTPMSASTIEALSASLFFFTAASTPSAIPQMEATIMAHNASSAVAGKRAASSDATGVCV